MLEEDQFTITFFNINDGPRSIIMNRGAHLTVTDDLGNTYRPSRLVAHYDEDEFGASLPHAAAVTFGRPLKPSARVLTIEVSDLARLTYGPDFDVFIPPVH